MISLRVLIGCEESGEVRDAFIKRGHDAWSNDLIPSRNGGPHIQKCVTRAIVEDGPWDIIILHYECTEMAVCANRWYAKGKPGYAKRLEALDFAERLWDLAKKHARIGCVFENPASTLWTRIGSPQYIQPHNFGHKEVKKTGLKQHNLPPLKHTNEVGPPPAFGTPERKSWERVWRMPKSSTRKRDRSKTYAGIAEALAEQYGVLR
jgi:hypothetical protein